MYAAPWAGAEAGHVTYLAPAAAEAAQVMFAAGAEAGQVMYASPATAEMGQAMYPWAGAEAGHVTYLAPVGAEAAQVMFAAGAEEGQQFTIDASGTAVMEGGQIASLVPTILEGSPVPTYVAPLK